MKNTKAEKQPQSLDKSLHREERTIVLGAGCFWGVEKYFDSLDGVLDVLSGYADGRDIEPSYQVIIQPQHRLNPDNYAEVVKITYDPEQVTLTTLLKKFFEHHDPTQGNRQGNDVGTQYRSTILYQNEEERQLAMRLRDEYQQQLTQAGYGKITTKIAPLDTFHPAEDYHQDYLAKNPNGYCPNHATGVKFALAEGEESTTPKTEKLDNSTLATGKHILVLEAPNCPYCEVFKKQIGDSYRGIIPMHYRQSDNIDGLSLKTKAWASPTIYFLDNGEEVFSHTGVMDNEAFYQALGAFQLGKDSEAYEVAFNEGTENRFCKKYEQFKETGDGVFVDALSGEPLFDTKYRFDSGSGWLSFTEALPDATIELPDNRYGMQRIEVRAKKTNIHLGHVFDDGPNGSRRFCINANVLRFEPR